MPAIFSQRVIARAQHVDHHDVHRARLEHVAEGRDAVDVLATCDGRRERLGHAREPRVVVMGGHVLEPVKAHVLDAPPDVDCLVHARALVAGELDRFRGSGRDAMTAARRRPARPL